MSIIIKNFLVCYADDSPLQTEFHKTSKRMPAVSAFNRDLARIGGWYKRWGMLVYPLKPEALVISRSRMPVLTFLNLLFDGTVVERVTEFRVFGFLKA